MPLGLRRFVPCDIGANHCRLRHIGWERCGHGLTSRPRESASEDFFTGLLFCQVCFLNFPLGGFLTGGHVCELVTDGVFGARVLDDDGIGRDLLPRFVGRAGGSFETRVLGALKEFDSTEKHQHTLQDLGTWSVFSLAPGFGRD